jgi:hypothetical protein
MKMHFLAEAPHVLTLRNTTGTTHRFDHCCRQPTRRTMPAYLTLGIERFDDDARGFSQNGHEYETEIACGTHTNTRVLSATSVAPDERRLHVPCP